MEIWSTRFIKIQNTASTVKDYKQIRLVICSQIDF